MTPKHLLRILSPIGLALLISTAAGAPPDASAHQDAAADYSSTGIAVGAAITFQGQLNKNGKPVNETCDMNFNLYDAANKGNELGGESKQVTSHISLWGRERN